MRVRRGLQGVPRPASRPSAAVDGVLSTWSAATKACNPIAVSNTLQAISEAFVFTGRAVRTSKRRAPARRTVERSTTAPSGWSAGSSTPASLPPTSTRAAASRPGREEYGVFLPVTQATHGTYEAMVETGHADGDDWVAIRVVEDLAGTEARLD